MAGNSKFDAVKLNIALVDTKLALVNPIADIVTWDPHNFFQRLTVTNLVERDTAGNILVSGVSERAAFEKISSFTRATNLIFVYDIGTGNLTLSIG